MASSPKLNQNYVPRGTEKTSEAFVKEFTETSQRQTALKSEHKNLFISILVGYLPPDIKKKIKDDVVGWKNQPFDIISVL